MDNNFIKNVNNVAAKLEEIVTANNLFNTESLSALEELKNLNITLIVEDFKKGNYLGNRKIDIDLSLNNTSTTSVPTYQRALVVLVDGTQLDMPFSNGAGGILELSSHADIKNYIVNHDLFSQVVDTEVVVIEAFGDTPAMMRVRDADGKASNIERIELFVFSGSVVENKVSYFWAKTTSALETLANRVGDIIQLGNDIDSIVNLSQRIEELIDLQEQISKIINVHDNLLSIVNTSNNMEAIVANNTYKNQFMAIYNKLSNLTEIHTNLAFILSSLQNAETAATKAQEASSSANSANQNAGVASNKATLATEKAQLAVDTLALIRGITVQASQLLSTQTAFVEYNSITNKFTFGIPQGTKGDRGEAFKVNSIGTFANRALYNSELENFSYLATDVVVDGSTIPHIYFKKSATIGDWTTGIPFGRGEKGDKGNIGVGISNIQRISGTGLSGSNDIYAISLSDGTSHEFTVHNGVDSDINSSDLTTLANNFNTALATKVNILDIKNNLISVDPDKPLSALQGKVLKEYIDHINTILTSSDTSLDDLQEIITFIKANKATLDTLGISNIFGLQVALDAKANLTDVYLKTVLDLKISTQQFDKPISGPLLIKVSPSSIKIPSGFKITVGANSFKLASDYTLTLASNLVGSTKTAGTDYYVYAKSDSTFYISASDAITADRLIGGFHYGLVGETETVTGNKLEADMVKIRGINSYSIWDLKYKPTASTKGMAKIGSEWYDIYLLNSEHITNGTSKAGLSIAGGDSVTAGRLMPKIPLGFGGNNTLNYGKFTWFQACEIAKDNLKRLISYSEFPTIAYGVLEGVSSSTNAYETVAGKIEHYPNLTSKFGIEQAAGVQWICGADLANYPTDTVWAWKANTDGRGQIYSTDNSPTAVILGGNRGDGARAGSRASHWRNSVWHSDWHIGCRFACDHLELV